MDIDRLYMAFQEHGEFSLEIDGKVLIIEGTGPFNKEIVAQYKAETEACIANLEHSSWYQLLTLHEMCLFTPDAEKALMDTIIDRHARGMVACAVNIRKDSCTNMVMEQISRCYMKVGVEHQYFTDKADAKAWLTSLDESLFST